PSGRDLFAIRRELSCRFPAPVRSATDAKQAPRRTAVTDGIEVWPDDLIIAVLISQDGWQVVRHDGRSMSSFKSRTKPGTSGMALPGDHVDWPAGLERLSSDTTGAHAECFVISHACIPRPAPKSEILALSDGLSSPRAATSIAVRRARPV